MTKAFGLWSTLPRALPYVRPYRRLGVGSMLLTFVSAALALAQPWPLAIMVDGVFPHANGAVGGVEGGHQGLVHTLLGTNPSAYAVIAYAATAAFMLTLLIHGATVLAHWFGTNLEQRLVLDLRSDLFVHAQRLSLTFHDARLTGQLMNQINVQASALGTIVLAFPPIVQALLTLVGMFVVTALIDWQLALLSLIAVPIIWWSLSIYGTRIVPRLLRVQRLEWQSLSIVHEAMSMLRVIVSFGRENHEFRRFRSQGEVAVDERVKLTVSQTVFSLGVSTATALGAALVMGFGAWHVLHGKISVGEMLVLIAYVNSIYQPLEEISNTAGDLNQHFVQFRSSLDLLDLAPEVEEAPDAIDIGRAAGRVAFENVHFAYQGRVETLKDVLFAVEPGQRVAIVGPTGAGKTTLISLLIRFYDPALGRITIDGVDIRKLKLASLREQIAVVLQEPLLFTGTITENIRYGNLEATKEEVVAAAKAANAHDFIEKLPQGYETELGERGSQLSGGERQRISVARAFVKDAPILILDEPTSSIDSRTEGVILDALEDLMEGRTSFMVSHRLSSVRDADLILVVQDGRIVEHGTHEDLLEQGGIYRQLHDAQTQQRRRRDRRKATASVGSGHNGSANGQDVPQELDGEPAVESADAEAGDFDMAVHASQARAKAEAHERALAAGDFDALSDPSGLSAGTRNGDE
jgi:ATP-binding cassette, subfamily B, bacterial